jgi:uncharacterized protein YjbI with pentapeptide repeats
VDVPGIRAKIRRALATWRALIISVVVLVVVIGGLVVLASSARLAFDQAPNLIGLDRQALETEKLREEVRALQQQNTTGGSPWGRILTLVPVLTVAVGGIGLLATVWRQLDERREQRRQEALDTARDDLRRFDENFAKTVEHLGSGNPALQASAVVSLTFLLTPEYKSYHDRVLLLAIATAKAGIEYSEAIGRLFVSAIEKAVRVRLAAGVGRVPDEALNLSRVRLDGVDFSGLDLTGADLAFASLHHANLTGSTLFRVRGFKVELSDARLSRANLGEARLNSAIAPNAQFHNAACISIRLEKAVLTGAQFYQARLQEGHLEGADLTGAAFEQADLNNAYFTGATFDDLALRSIATGAVNWPKAHFDAAVMARLRALDHRPGTPSIESGPELQGTEVSQPIDEAD